MNDFTYSFRPGVFSAERRYDLRPARLEWTTKGRTSGIAYDEVERILVYQSRFLGSSATYWTCVIVPRGRRPRIKLGAANRIGFRSIEDRTGAYIPFIKELERRIAAANPDAEPRAGRHWLSRIEAAGGHVAVWALRAARRFDLDRTAGLAAWLTRKLGPLVRGHRLARRQLEQSFPEKSPDEIRRILDGMWDNLARVMIENVHLETLWDYDLRAPGRGRIVIEPATADRLDRLSTDIRPGLFFSGHLGNWELLGRANRGVRRNVALVYKTPRNNPLGAEITRIRSRALTEMIAAGPEAFLRIRTALKQNWLVGMLVDQHYAGGVEVTFFGRKCTVNATLARFARMFDCPIYGARIVRLPDRKFRYEVAGPLPAPRDADGKIDVAGTMQLTTSMIEGWVREHPEQWMWLHRRWR